MWVLFRGSHGPHSGSIRHSSAIQLQLNYPICKLRIGGQSPYWYHIESLYWAPSCLTEHATKQHTLLCTIWIVSFVLSCLTCVYCRRPFAPVSAIGMTGFSAVHTSIEVTSSRKQRQLADTKGSVGFLPGGEGNNLESPCLALGSAIVMQNSSPLLSAHWDMEIYVIIEFWSYFAAGFFFPANLKNTCEISPTWWQLQIMLGFARFH